MEVTVLFADLAGFTQLTNALGAQRSYEVVSAFFAMANSVLVQHDAYIDKYIGDAVMAFFNVPIQSQNHNHQAIKAALAIQQGMASVSATIGIPLQARIGVACGYARMGRVGSSNSDNFTVIGDVVNLAARLESLARPGEVLVDAVAFASFAGMHSSPLPETLAIRGFSESVQAFRLNQAGDPAPVAAFISSEPAAARKSVGLGSILFTILGAPCALSATLSPLSLVLGISTAASSSGSFSHMLDAAQIRIPLQVFGVLGALVNLYVARQAMLRHKLAKVESLTVAERRNLQIVIGLGIFSLLAVALETWHHIFIKGLSYFEPLL